MINLKNVLWVIVVLIIALVIGYILGVVTWPRQHIIVTATNTNVTQIIGHIDNPTDIEKREIDLLTNSITHPRFVNDQRDQKLNVTFAIDYKLSSGNLLPLSWRETYEIPVKDTGWIIGGGWDIMRTAPAVLLGYHWRSLALIGTFTISTNFGTSIFAVWLP